MAFLFQKFQGERSFLFVRRKLVSLSAFRQEHYDLLYRLAETEEQAVKELAKSPTFARNPRHLQFEADMNRLFLFTSYNRLGRNADEADIDEIIDIATKASLSDQQSQVQENVHSQIRTFCTIMDEILLPGKENVDGSVKSSSSIHTTHKQSGLSFAVGSSRGLTSNHPVVPETKPVKLNGISGSLKDQLGYTLSLQPSKIPHKDAGQGLYLEGKASTGAVIAIYPGIIYSPAYYRYIPGYPKIDAQNPYLITRYDGMVINAQPWGVGGESREPWDGTSEFQTARPSSDEKNTMTGSDRVWKVLSKPLSSTAKGGGSCAEVLERRNPLAFAHFANHPGKGMAPNVMVCPYDFPLGEKEMRPYVPNLVFGGAESSAVRMRRFGSFWFKSWGSGNGSGGADCGAVLKSLVLVATREICDEEILLNYRLSNSKRRPEWYTPVDEEEDRRRWG